MATGLHSVPPHCSLCSPQTGLFLCRWALWRYRPWRTYWAYTTALFSGFCHCCIFPFCHFTCPYDISVRSLDHPNFAFRTRTTGLPPLSSLMRSLNYVHCMYPHSVNDTLPRTAIASPADCANISLHRSNHVDHVDQLRLLAACLRCIVQALLLKHTALHCQTTQ